MVTATFQSSSPLTKTALVFQIWSLMSSSSTPLPVQWTDPVLCSKQYNSKVVITTWIIPPSAHCSYKAPDTKPVRIQHVPEHSCRKIWKTDSKSWKYSVNEVNETWESYLRKPWIKENSLDSIEWRWIYWLFPKDSNMDSFKQLRLVLKECWNHGFSKGLL